MFSKRDIMNMEGIMVLQAIKDNAGKRNATVVELSDELLECIPNPNATMEQEELSYLLRSFLKTLPEQKQKLFIRRYWYGESIKELATAFGSHEEKIKSILFRIRKQLWKELNKTGIL